MPHVIRREQLAPPLEGIQQRDNAVRPYYLRSGVYFDHGQAAACGSNGVALTGMGFLSRTSSSLR
ncbi:MAG: hypothetical protein QM758_05775 [Armatimonas sp.]